MRKTFRTYAAEETNFTPDVIEICLAHKVGSCIERVYNKGQLLEKRRQLMNMWGDYCNAAPVIEIDNVHHLCKA
jgi:hypothetical protein